MNQIREEKYKMLTDSTLIIEEIYVENVFENKSKDLTQLYLLHLDCKYTLKEIKLMKKTLENALSSINLNPSVVTGFYSIIIIAMVMLFENADRFSDSEKISVYYSYSVIGAIAISVMVLLNFYLKTMRLIEQKVKIINYLDLFITLKEKSK